MRLSKRITVITSLILSVLFILNPSRISVYAEDYKDTGFRLAAKTELNDSGAAAYSFYHIKTGAQVVYLDNDSERREFAIGFKTPPADSKGANHVLEHALLCGSEQYPVPNIMHYIEQGTSSLILNGVTVDDLTYYLIQTSNPTEYSNTMDVYLNGIFHPLLLRDKNIFRQQGIRLEYDGEKAIYNGVVYNELRLKNLDTVSNSLTFLSDKLYSELYGDTTPAFSSGGSLDALKTLTYEDLLRVYNTYYIPSNSMTYIAGKQDISETLKVLDKFFSEYDSQKPDITFHDTKQIPADPVSECNMTPDTKTVDIGFMSSGVPMSADPKELYARNIIFNIIYRRMGEKNEKNYTLGGSSGGISTLALLASEIPIEQKDAIIAAYQDILHRLETNGFDNEELDREISDYMENGKNTGFYSNYLDCFNGILYHNDPFAFSETDTVRNELIGHKEYFAEILKKYFTANPYSKIVVSGNGLPDEKKDNLPVSGEELEKIKLETEKFREWADRPDNPEVIEKLPLITLDEVKNAPSISDPVYEQANGISFYHTDSDEDSADLFFPLCVKNEELNLAQLLISFLTAQTEKSGLDNLYFGLLPMESAQDSKKINPQLFIGFNGEEITDNLKSALSFLRDDATWNTDDLITYIKTAPDQILKKGYRDPYYLSYELKQSALSYENRFYAATMGSVQQGSVAYYHFLKSINPQDAPVIIENLRSLADTLILNSKPTVEYVGSSGYDRFRNAVIEQFQNTTQRESTDLQLPVGYDSVATITALEGANHFMMAGYYDKSEYSGKLLVLGNILSSKYILPTMRGKYGAYGAGVFFYESSMTAAVAGLADIDLAIEIWQGMGDYLKNLEMTQKELDSIIVSAVEQYDDSYTDLEYGGQKALCGKSTKDWYRIRNEMLSTTVEDLRAYADFVDRLTAQNRVFSVLGKQAANNAKFQFSYYADADTLDITPRFKKQPDTAAAEQIADGYITRADAALLILYLAADSRLPEQNNPYRDLSSNDPRYNAIVSASEKGILSGFGDNTFMPEKNMTRAELASVLSKFIFRGNAELETTFSDLSKEDWFYAPFAKMVNAGFIEGYDDGTLRPENPVTKAEAMTIIKRMCE